MSYETTPDDTAFMQAKNSFQLLIEIKSMRQLSLCNCRKLSESQETGRNQVVITGETIGDLKKFPNGLGLNSNASGNDPIRLGRKSLLYLF